MQSLTKDNYRLFAAKAYDNPYCLSEDEFEADLKKISTIKRMISYEANGVSSNISLLVNHFISFYNVFSHKSATMLLAFNLRDCQKPYANSVLAFLNRPTIEGFDGNLEFYKRIQMNYDRI